MFDEKAYDELMKSEYFKAFVKYCLIGFSAALIVFLLVVVAVMMVLSGLIGFIARHIVIMIVGFAGGVIALCLVTMQLLYNKKPELCAYGEVTAIKGSHATVMVGSREICGSSFDKFLKNKKLNNFRPGDKVLIYSSRLKHGRPLFSKTG